MSESLVKSTYTTEATEVNVTTAVMKLRTKFNACGCVFGTCKTQPQYYCACWNGYFGDRCANSKVSSWDFSSKERSEVVDGRYSSYMEIFTSGLVLIAFVVVGVFIWRKYRKRRNNVNAHRISKTTIEGYSTPDGRSAYCVETSNEGYVPTKFRRVTSIYNESEIEISDSNADICNKTATNNGSTSEPRVNTRYSRQARLISKPIEKTLSNDHSAHKTVALPVMSAEQLV